MTDAMLAVFGLSGGEIVLILAILAIGGLLLVGITGIVAYLVVRFSRRTHGTTRVDGSGG